MNSLEPPARNVSIGGWKLSLSRPGLGAQPSDGPALVLTKDHRGAEPSLTRVHCRLSIALPLIRISSTPGVAAVS